MNQDKIIDIEDLTPDAHNFNQGTDEGRQLMQRSLSELGAGRSILVDRNGNVIAGNKTQEAAIKAGIRRVRVIETDGTELVAVKRTDIDIDSAKGRELALVDNLATQVNLAWDEAELEAMDVEGFDPASWGLELDIKDPTADVEVQEDDFDPDAQPVPTICKTGDLWQLGNHRLLCGDSTKAEDVAKLMQGEQADLWLTDPPYNVEYVGAKKRRDAELGDKLSQHEEIENDVMDNSQYEEFLTKVFKASESVMRKGCPFYIWYASTFHSIVERSVLSTGLLVKQQLIWNKNSMVLGWYDYNFKHEPCLYGWKDGAKHYFVNLHNRTTVWSDAEEIDIDKMKKDEMKKLLHEIFDSKTPTTVINEKRPTTAKDHPTMKPVRLFGYLMQNSSRQHDIILDTFGGSGTTIVAAEQLDRRARLMELDPHYCDVIIARWEKLTGGKAIKL